MLISSSVNLFVFYSFRNEEKLVAQLVYSSIRRVATSGIRNSSVTTVVLFEFESLRIHHSTAARHSCNSFSDVTRLVTTEHVRKKYSLRESILLQTSHATSSTNSN